MKNPLNPGAPSLLKWVGAAFVTTLLLGLLDGCSGSSNRRAADNTLPAGSTQTQSLAEVAKAVRHEGTITSVTPGTSFELHTRNGQDLTFQLGEGMQVRGLPLRTPGQFAGLQIGQQARVILRPGQNGTPLAGLVVCGTVAFRSGPRIDAEPKEPAARIYHQAAYRERSDEMFVFAGQSAPGWVNDVLDMWSYQVGSNRWHYLGEQSVANYDSVAFDASADRIVVYNPFDANGNALETPETWAFNPRTHAWENRQALNPPPTRWGSMMVYDAHAKKCVLFAGGDMNTWLPRNDTWTYDYDRNTWTQLETTVIAPSPMNYGAMAYDSQAQKVILFSGNTWDENFHSWNVKETWTLDVHRASWSLVPTTAAPASRNYHRMTYDTRNDRVLMFGGCTGTDVEGDPLVPQNDTWAFQTRTGTWQLLGTRNAPGPRGWHTLEFSARSGKAVVFGGGVSREAATNETWIYFSPVNLWENVLE